MSCTRRGFLKTVGAAMVGLGLTRLEPLRTFAASSVNLGSGAEAGGPPGGPYSVAALRAQAVEAARVAGDAGLAGELAQVCCWAPAATAIRERPLAVQTQGARYFFNDFPGGDQLADIMVHTNNTSWYAPRFNYDPESAVARHYALLQKRQSGIEINIVTPDQLDSVSPDASLGLVLDRKTGERLAQAADRSEPMWAALSVFSGMMLDPTDDLSRRLTPLLSLTRANDRAVARTAAVRYGQIVLGAVQRAVWSDELDGVNPALPLLQLTAAGYLPLGEGDGRFHLLNMGTDRSYLTGYRTGNV